MKRRLEFWKRKLQFCTRSGLLFAVIAALGLTTLAQGGDPCTDPDAIITVEILTDDFGGETTWELVEQGVGVIASGGPYPNNTLITVDVPVCSTSCYNFTIFDSFGDGICCGFGIGFYNIFYEGNLVCSGGEFGDSETCADIGAGCGGGGGCNPKSPKCNSASAAGGHAQWGQLVSGHGGTEIYERRLGGGRKVITFVTWTLEHADSHEH